MGNTLLRCELFGMVEVEPYNICDEFEEPALTLICVEDSSNARQPV